MPKVEETKNPVTKKLEVNSHDPRRVILDILPAALINKLDTYTGRVDGFSAGVAPLTFRWLTSWNTFAMITTDIINAKDTVMSVAAFNTNEGPKVLDDVIAGHKEALVNEKLEEDKLLQKKKEHAQKMAELRIKAANEKSKSL